MDISGTKTKKEPIQGGYILSALGKHCLNGDAYVYADELYAICKKEYPKVSYAEFQEDFKHLLHEGRICREGRRVYLWRTLRYEDSAAKSLAEILKNNAMPCPVLPSAITAAGGLPLCREQWEAVRMALSCRLSIVLGGAGTGKSTLIRAITQFASKEAGRVLCAPTGKAARNLSERPEKWFAPYTALWVFCRTRISWIPSAGTAWAWSLWMRPVC